MRVFDDVEIIAAYPLSQALEDGVLVELCDIRWGITRKPFIATAHVLEGNGRDGAMAIWNEFVNWKTKTEPTLPDEEKLFCTGVDQEKIWIIEDEATFTIMYPEDY